MFLQLLDRLQTGPGNREGTVPATRCPDASFIEPRKGSAVRAVSGETSIGQSVTGGLHHEEVGGGGVAQAPQGQPVSQGGEQRRRRLRRNGARQPRHEGVPVPRVRPDSLQQLAALPAPPARSTWRAAISCRCVP